MSKSGLSTSFGPRGLHYTVGNRRRRTTIGIPGTGLSYTSYSTAHAYAASRKGLLAPAAPASAPPSTATLSAMLPAQKIGVGLLLIVLVIPSPIGLWLLVAGLWQLHEPEWKARALARRANTHPAEAEALLDQAMAIDAHEPEVLASLAALRARQQENAAACSLYREYCARVPGDWLARGHYADAALHANQLDEAIAAYQAVMAGVPLDRDSVASVHAQLAYAFLCKGDPAQARSFVGTSGSPRLGRGAQECCRMRAICAYLLGHRDTALGQLGDLYAANPAFPGVQAMRAAMAAGTFELMLQDGTTLSIAGDAPRGRQPELRRGPPISPHCRNCLAPVPSGASECPSCHAAVA